MFPSSKSRFERHLLGVLAAVMMLFGQSIAVGAVQSSGGAWIEICSGDGSKLVQTEDEAPQKDCSHCDYCTVQFSPVSCGPEPLTLIGLVPVFASVQFVAVTAEIRPDAEQYWAASRGPPLTSEVNMNTFSTPWVAMIISLQGGESWL